MKGRDFSFHIPADQIQKSAFAVALALEQLHMCVANRDSWPHIFLF
jgi:hypothetical protein